MPLAEINWKKFLEPGSVPPPDVFFTILEDQPSDAMSKLEDCVGVSKFSESDPAADDPVLTAQGHLQLMFRQRICLS